MQKQLGSKNHLENEKHNEITIPKLLFKEEQSPVKNKIKNVNNPKPLKQKVVMEKFKIEDKVLEKELNKKMINPYCVIDENLMKGFKNNLESHNNNRANSLLTIIPLYQDFEFETRYINEILKKQLLLTLF